jgi:hypothetical protein
MYDTLSMDRNSITGKHNRRSFDGNANEAIGNGVYLSFVEKNKYNRFSGVKRFFYITISLTALPA